MDIVVPDYGGPPPGEPSGPPPGEPSGPPTTEPWESEFDSIQIKAKLQVCGISTSITRLLWLVAACVAGVVVVIVATVSTGDRGGASSAGGPVPPPLGASTVSPPPPTPTSNTYRPPPPPPPRPAIVPTAANTGPMRSMGEVGTVAELAEDFVTVNLQRTDYTNPVVFGGVPTEHGGDEVVVRINGLRYKTRGCDGWCFDIRLQEPSCLDQRHPYPETVHWMVMEAGSWVARDGVAPKMLQVGTAGIFGGSFTEVFFHAGGFTTDALSIIHQVQTYNDRAFAKTRGCDNTNCPGHPEPPAENWHLSRTSFFVTLEREGGGLEQQHGHERIGWLASEIGRMRFGDRYFEAGYTEQVVTGNNADAGHSAYALAFEQPFSVVPFFFGTLATFQGWDATQLRVSSISEDGAYIFCEEERCSDDEQTHIAEKVGWLAIDESPFGDQPTMIQAEPIIGVAMQTSVGESGMLTGLMADWVTVELRGIYRRPVFFAGIPSANGGDHVVVRLQAKRTDCPGSNCFRVRLQEPGCLDQVHPAQENLAWMAFETGTFRTDEDVLLMTGLHPIGGGAVEASSFSPVAYYEPFDDANVVVFTSVQTFNDPHFVKTRQQPSTAEGFRVALEQEASAVSTVHVHGQELVGWLATKAVGSGTIGSIRYQATTTSPGATEVPYDITFSAGFNAGPRLFGSIATWNGHDSCSLRTDPTTAAGATVYLEEETCFDSEVEHPNPESINFFALESIAGANSFMLNANPVTHAELIDAPTAVGELGQVTTTNTANADDSWVTVELTGAYFSPIIFGGIPTMAGAQEAVVRFQNIRRAKRGDEGVTNDQLGHWMFDLRVQEPACQDDVHAVETISWMVMDTGVFFSDEDFMIQTGSVAASGGDWKQVNYNAGGFPSSSEISVMSHVQVSLSLALSPSLSLSCFLSLISLSLCPHMSHTSYVSDIR